MLCMLMYIFLLIWDLFQRLIGYPFAYTYITLWDLSRGSESLQLTPSKDFFFITSLTFHSKHRGLAFMDLSISVMLETSILIVSYAFYSHPRSCFMLKTSFIYFHDHAFNTQLSHKT